MNESYGSDPQTSILDDHLELIQYEEASMTKRLFNWLIDLVVMRFTLMYAVAYLILWLVSMIAPQYLYDPYGKGNGLQLILYTYIMWEVSIFVYYFISEKAFRGYTVGKLITGTRVIRLDGKELTLKDALLRSLYRLTPFETISALNGPPWHDLWSKTVVINTRR